MSRHSQSPEDLAGGVLRGDRPSLARAITLIESMREADAEAAEKMLARLDAAVPPFAFRLGITGAPGAGKSTLIEALGVQLCEQGRRVAVLAVDPSSVISGGSLLGDKTRMSGLSHHPAAFVRPSPSLGIGGGLGAATADAARLCEAAGYDFVIIETVGVGQGEIDVRDVADLVLVLVDPGGGDGLQAVKRGLLEVADLIAVTKSDGDRRGEAERTRAEFEAAMGGLSGGQVPAVLLSSVVDAVLLDSVVSELLTREGKLAGSMAAKRDEQFHAQFVKCVSHVASQWAAEHPGIRRHMADLPSGTSCGAKMQALRIWRKLTSGLVSVRHDS